MSLSDRIAAACTRATATSACVLVFLALSVAGFPSSHKPQVIVQWLSTTCLQLVMLPLLAVGQKVLASAHAEHADRLDELHTKVDGLTEKAAA